MLNLSAATRVFVATAPVARRGSFNRLFALTQAVLQQDPLSGHWFVFTNRQRRLFAKTNIAPAHQCPS